MPDGSRVTQEHDRTGSDRNLIVTRGAPSGADGIGEGISTATTRDQNGIIQSKFVTAKGGAGNGVVLNQLAVILPTDNVGRPKEIQYFGGSPAGWTISREYACCGLLSETDKYGLITYYHHDDLGRRIRTNRLGVTHATVYDGLSISSHRYAETVTGGTWTGAPAAANRISRTTRNLSGTFRHSWTRSPETEGTNPNGTPPTYSQSSTLFTTTESKYRNPAAATPNPHGLPTNVGLQVIRKSVQVSDDGSNRPTETTDYHLDGRILKTISDVSPNTLHSYTANATGLKTSVSYLEGTTLRETTDTQYDRAGRVKNVTKGGHPTNYFYGTTGNATGKLVKVTDADNVTTLYGYNAKGERTTTAIDHNGDGIINPNGSDRITITETVPGTYAGHHVWTTTTKVHATVGSAATTTVQTSHSATNGLRQWTLPVGSPLSSTITVLGANGNRTTTTTHPDGTKTVNIHTAGRLTRVEQLSSDATPVLLTFTDYQYDTLNRPWKSTDSRTGLTTTTYLSNTSDFVKSVEDAGLRTTSFTYDHRGRRKSIDAPSTPIVGGTAQNVTFTTHEPDGSIKSVTGDQTYPVSYTYDYAARMKSMTTTGTSGNVITA